MTTGRGADGGARRAAKDPTRDGGVRLGGGTRRKKMQILSFAQDDSVKRRAKRMRILRCAQDDNEEGDGRRGRSAGANGGRSEPRP